MNSPQPIFVLSILFFLLTYQLKGQSPTAIFEYLSAEDGLPQNHVFDVTQDADGFIWFSTMGGLSKYDGFTFTNYHHREGDSTTLTSNYINAFYQDRESRCWVVTPNGFNQWDRRTGKATRFVHDPSNPKSLGHNLTRALTEDQEGFIWIAHDKGLDKFNPVTYEFQHYFNEQFGVARHSGAVVVDQHGDIWSAGVTGIFKIDRDKKELKFVKGLPPSDKFPPFEGRDLFIDSHDRIWLAFKSGFARYIPSTNEYEVFSSDLFANGVIKIREYDPNTLAIATVKGGLVLWDISSQQIKAKYQHSPFDEHSIRGHSIYSLYIDRTKNIWLGLFYGISVTNLETERFRFIRHAFGFANYANFVLRVYKDSRGGIWSNTMAGLYYQRDLNSQSTEFIQLPYFPQGYKNFQSITGDGNGKVYFGFSKVGLYQFNYDDNQLTLMDEAKKVDVENLHFVYPDILIDYRLWICTSTGLFRFDVEKNEVRHFQPASMDMGLTSNAVIRLTQDSSGNIYFINSGKICRLAFMSNIIDTLICQIPIEGTINGIDINRNILWIGSHEAIYKYNLTSHACEKIKSSDGSAIGSSGLCVDHHGTAWSVAQRIVTRIVNDSILQYRSPVGFVTGIGSRSSDGLLLFGGDKGVLLIDPDDFYVDTTYPEIRFSGIDVANKPKALTQQPEYIQAVELSHLDKVFTLHYAPLHFIHRQGLTYEYQLEGFDKEWIAAGSNRSVTYTNLPHGTYTFRVVAKTEDGLASKKPLAVQIVIKPPFYKTYYFYSLVVLLAGGLLYLLYTLRRKASNLKKEKILAQQQAAYQRMFLSNMSHEIRTPMNAILGLNNLLLQTPLTTKQEEYAKAISVSCDNLLWIVNDILDQSKIESGTYSIEQKPFNLQAILHQLEILFSHIANEKKIRLTFEEHGDLSISLLGDPVRLIQILSNLLNNAIKFTDEGEIKLVAHLENPDHQNVKCTFTVTDSGIGIPADKLTAIFDSFQQVNEKIMAGNQGTGLGLSIVKYLVNKMGGDINVNSVHGSGSEFIVTLPFKVNKEIIENMNGAQSAIAIKSGLRILLVEDAPLNQLVATELMKKWLDDPSIEIADNGAEALVKIRQAVYDLILMDVKMPVMDGLEATRRIRNMEGDYFKSVPIVGLTANVIHHQKKECEEAGMNGFISKPIMQEEFLQNLAKQVPA